MVFGSGSTADASLCLPGDAGTCLRQTAYYLPSAILEPPDRSPGKLHQLLEMSQVYLVVDRKAKKQEIKTAIEKMFKVKVVKVNTFITPKGEKRAYVRFSPETPAIDIATNMGLM